MQKSEIFFVFFSFLIWRVCILLIAIFAINNVPVFSNNFFGGRFLTYQTDPLFWGHMNFDGEHFLSIAQGGYKPIEYFFFPLYPNIVRIFSFSKDLVSLATTGIVVSNLAFLMALIGIYKLVKFDLKKEIARLTLLLILVFPTSFYFAIFYSESLFLCLAVWTIYFVRRNKFIFAAIITALISATRVIGIIILPVILVEYLIQKRRDIRLLGVTAISPLGLFGYMYYLFKQTGDPVIFLHQIAIYGEQRSSSLILLPQVIYRYFFKIVPNISYSYFPNIFTTYLELVLSLLFLGIILLSVKKLRLSYVVYAALAFIIPTFAGSFSSMPRYLIVVFPVFIYLAILLNKTSLFFKYFVFLVMGSFLIIATSLFWRGYWIS